jgi:hypothetical protein
MQMPQDFAVPDAGTRHNLAAIRHAECKVIEVVGSMVAGF